jgi:hypothetical protein
VLLETNPRSLLYCVVLTRKSYFKFEVENTDGYFSFNESLMLLTGYPFIESFYTVLTDLDKILR